MGATVRLTGRRLARASAVGFPGPSGELAAAPSRIARRAIDVVVPEGARTGRPRVLDPAGHAAIAPRLRILAADALPPPGSFDLQRATVRPRAAFFDAKRRARLRYRFRGYGALDLRATVVRRGDAIRSWVERDRTPFSPHSLAWNGLTGNGATARTGRYRFRIAPAGGEAHSGPRFRFYDHRFPVRGRHSYGERFGVPRSGGRVHEGQDLWASCGTRLDAARGGKVQARGYSGALYGHYLVIDGRRTERDYMYSHLVRPPPVKRGARVRTGQRIGAVGRSGNARGEGCQLHFEIWPRGWRHGRPMDPLRELRRWDGWS